MGKVWLSEVWFDSEVTVEPRKGFKQGNTLARIVRKVFLTVLSKDLMSF